MVNKVSKKSAGGIARAKALTPEDRKRISAKAVAAKAEIAKMPKATHFGVLKIGDSETQCFVLDDGRRVISGRSLTAAIGMKGRGQGAARISGHKLVKHNENNELALAIENPIKFIGKSPQGANIPSDGYEAIVLQEVCESILSARDKGLLASEQDKRYAVHADALIRGFAKVGIVALVDEATGYQKDRAKDALAQILESFVARELQPYMKTFPADYYEQLFRLRGLPFPPEVASFRPQYFGKLTNDIIYKRIAPGLLLELKRQNEKDEKKGKLHQRLTLDLGYQKLRDHISATVMAMKLSKDYPDFIDKMNKFYPRYGDTLQLELDPADQG